MDPLPTRLRRATLPRGRAYLLLIAVFFVLIILLVFIFALAVFLVLILLCLLILIITHGNHLLVTASIFTDNSIFMR